MPELTIIQQIAVWLIPVLFAITFHEAAHAYVADYLGDTTAKMLGRISLNPLKHIDPWGTIVIPILTLILSNFSFVFGWAKPVPINANLFAKPRRDLAISTAAGPLANLLMAFLWTICLKLAVLSGSPKTIPGLFLVLVARAGIIINLLLAFVNLIPIPPLDGSRIAASLMPPKMALKYLKIEPYGFIILLVFLYLGLLSWLIAPPVEWTLVLFKRLFNL